jgi:aspartate dehydrogenase
MVGATEFRVAVGGLGAIGMKVAETLDKGGIPGCRLVAVAAGDKERAAKRVAGFRNPPRVTDLAGLAEDADIVVEGVPARLFGDIAEPTLKAGRIFIPLSVGALLERMDLVDLAAENGARIHVPSGALLGLDAVRGAAEGEIHSVTMETRKPPRGLKGAPYIEQNGIDLDAISEPTVIFEGSAREAVKGFPANVNVAVALSLAGIGPDKTTIRLYADPTVDRNTHTITVDADSTRFTMKIEGVPSPENPATGKLTPLSVLAVLRSLASPLQVGT